jgi:hypothetical protein
MMLATVASALVLAGSPWAALERPLHLPKVNGDCPVSAVDPHVDWDKANIFGGSGLGRGPAYPGLGGQGDFIANQPLHGGWSSGKLFWYVLPSYRGRVLVRGRRLDGPPDRMRFEHMAGALRITPQTTVEWDGQVPGSRGVPSGVRIKSSGCYGVQFDGTSFSRTVVFRARITS